MKGAKSQVTVAKKSHSPVNPERKAPCDKLRAERQRLRRVGLRPIEIWVPDVNSPEFAAEAHRQSLLIANSPHAKEDQDWVDAVSDWKIE
jgi:Protein  of unknown function (DUF3018)